MKLAVSLLMLIPTLALADGTPDRFNEATIADLQRQMASGRLTSVELTRFYLERIVRIDQKGPHLNAVIELNPEALAMAITADVERRHGQVRGPLHGIPILLKDNIDTGDRMQTSAGSFALVGAPAVRDSTVVANLRAGGAVILGKTNLSEWANFRSFWSSAGWSGRGGLTHNPYALDHSACGSSSGSGAAVSANLAAVALGTETSGSLVCPASVNGIVAIKPTVGLTSRAGVVPLAHDLDSVGPLGRTVADAATVLGIIQSRTSDGRDPATGDVPTGWRGRPRPTNLPADYTQFLDSDGLAGATIGVTRQNVDNAPPQVVAAWDAAVAAMQAAGANIVDIDAAGFTFPSLGGVSLLLYYDFKADLASYFATRVGVPMAGRTLTDAIAFNDANAAVEMPFFAQENFEVADLIDTSGPDVPQPVFGGFTYNQALDAAQNYGVNGIDLALSQFHLDAIVAPTTMPANSVDLLTADSFFFASAILAAVPGYPIVEVPAANVFGLPMGVSFFGTAFSEPTLIKLASGFEAATQARTEPTFSPTLPNDHISGVPLVRPHRRPRVDTERALRHP